MIASETARTGLQANNVRQAVSAHNTANVNTDGFAKQKTTQQTQAPAGVSTQVDTVSLSEEAKAISEQVAGSQNNVEQVEEAVTQIQSQSNFEQNATVLRTQDEMNKTSLDMLG